MSLYLDTAYVAKCYLNEPDAPRVRAMLRGVIAPCSSEWCRAELACVLLRHVREGALTRTQARAIHRLFLKDVDDGVWALMSVSGDLMRRVESAVLKLRHDVFLRAGDAIHLLSAAEAGFSEIWTSDRHLLTAAPQFGLTGRSV